MTILSKMKKKIIIFGNGEIAKLAHYYFRSDSVYEVVGFTVDKINCASNSFNNLPLIPFETVEEKFPVKEHLIHVAISYKKLNQLREQKFNEAKEKGYLFANYISSKSTVLTDKANLGNNLFILEGQTIQKDVIISDNVMIWSNNHIGHNTFIGKHCYISSGVIISGHCKIGERCFLGVNSTITDFCKIGDDCFITMGSNIGHDIKNKSTAVNRSTEILENGNRAAEVIKKKYFKF